VPESEVPRRNDEGSGIVTPVNLREVADAMRSLSADVAPENRDGMLQRLVTVAVERVPPAQWASVSMLRGGRFTTPASTGEVATRADQLQYELGSVPCVDAAMDDSVLVTGDVAAEERWPEWSQRVVTEVGVRSVISQRLHLFDDSGVVAGLNLYSDEPAAFDDQSVGMGLVLATHASMMLSETIAKERATNLGRALESNREIGVAVGILMHQQRVTREQAFDLLRVASQNSTRKLDDVAAEVAATGVLSIQPRQGAQPVEHSAN
jgi:hypothetical protein